jgi:hypothetical protein
VVGQEDEVHLEVGVVAEEALEVIVAGEASEVAEGREGSVPAVAVVAVAEGDSGEVVVVSEGHDICSRHAFVSPRNFKTRESSRLVESSERTRSGHLKTGHDLSALTSSSTS